MTDHPFNNDASPAERKAVTENDARVREQQRAATYASFAEAFADEDRRYNTGKPPIHTAATPVYPELPSNSPFHHDPVGQEPPLGFSVEDHQPVGTFQEVQESLKRLGEAGSIFSRFA